MKVIFIQRKEIIFLSEYIHISIKRRQKEIYSMKFTLNRDFRISSELERIRMKNHQPTK